MFCYSIIREETILCILCTFLPLYIAAFLINHISSSLSRNLCC